MDNGLVVSYIIEAMTGLLLEWASESQSSSTSSPSYLGKTTGKIINDKKIGKDRPNCAKLGKISGFLFHVHSSPWGGAIGTIIHPWNRRKACFVLPDVICLSVLVGSHMFLNFLQSSDLRWTSLYFRWTSMQKSERTSLFWKRGE